MEAIQEYIAIVLKRAFAEDWDPVRPTSAELFLSENKIGIRFFIRRNDLPAYVVHEEVASFLESREDADDFIARALSNFLMKHPTWAHK